MSAAAVVVEDAAAGSAEGGPNPKIIDLITPGTEDGTPFVSLEYFPPRTEEGVKVRFVPKRPKDTYRTVRSSCRKETSLCCHLTSDGQGRGCRPPSRRWI